MAGFDLCMKQSLQDEPGQILGQASVRRSRSFRIHWSPPWATGSLVRSTKDDEQKMTFRRDEKQEMTLKRDDKQEMTFSRDEKQEMTLKRDASKR